MLAFFLNYFKLNHFILIQREIKREEGVCVDMLLNIDVPIFSETVSICSISTTTSASFQEHLPELLYLCSVKIRY